MRLIRAFAVTVQCCVFSVCAQGTFQNLNFEAAYPNIQPTSPPGLYDVTTALPGWTAFYGTDQQTQVGYNNISTGATYILLIGTNDPYYVSSIGGRYSVLLQGGVSAAYAAISQTGLVPATAESILFRAKEGAGPLILSMGGQSLPIFAVGSGSNYTLYGADISAYSGQTEQLEFSAPSGYFANNNWMIDNIQFSSSPVPEPSESALAALGILLLGFRRWKH